MTTNLSARSRNGRTCTPPGGSCAHFAELEPEVREVLVVGRPIAEA